MNRYFLFIVCIAWPGLASTNKPLAMEKFAKNRMVKQNVRNTMDVKIEKQSDDFKQTVEEYHFGDHVHLVDAAFYMPQLNKHRRIWIYLPKSYSKSKKKYPVMYMHDGQNLFHANPPRPDEWAIDSVMDSLIRSGSKEMIVVGTDHAGKDRLKEYNPYDSQYGKGEGKAYAKFLVETLKPYIDAHYRTLKEAKNTTIAGSSMGGLISMYTIAEYPEVFGAAGIFSPALWLAPQMYTDLQARLANLKNNRLFFVVGDQEGKAMIRDVKKAFEMLNPGGKNKEIVLEEREDGKHTEWFWHREFESFYQFIAK